MPIKPPNLDDRRYADLVSEARALIPQYCPEWTNLSDADPGMTLVQLFAWMTEMTIYRLNRVPDKTYIHFLNFIGEERREALPATVPLTFSLRGEESSVEIPPFTRCSTQAAGTSEAIHFLTTDRLTVHGAQLQRIVAVRTGGQTLVREVPFTADEDHPEVLQLGSGQGAQLFRMDAISNGPHAATPDQFLYLAHDDLRWMDFEDDGAHPIGRLRIRSANEQSLPIAGMFYWEHHTADGWVPIATQVEDDEVLGVPEIALRAHLPDQQEVPHFGRDDDPFPIPEPLRGEALWLRGRVDYERWLMARMQEDLEITWRDDRGGDQRVITNWDIRATGRALEFFIQDMPPIRPGWTVRFTMVDRSMPAGRNNYFPRYRFSVRTGQTWTDVPADRVHFQGTSIVLTGPFTDMATDGYNLRAERIESVFLRGMMPSLEVEATWLRPVIVHLATGPETGAAVALEAESLPQEPFQPAPTLPPLMGMKLFVGADVLDNRAGLPVMVELEVSFEVEGEPVEEPKKGYHMQLTYRAADTWRVVHTDDGRYSKFTFADLDAEGALEPGRRKIRLLLDPTENLKGQFRSELAGRETNWLRLELTKALLTHKPNNKAPGVPISVRVHAVRIGVDGVIGQTTYAQPLPGLKSATVEYRPNNRRLSRAIVRSAGRLSEHHPFDSFIDITDDPGDDATGDRHAALYLRLDRPLPVGARHAFAWRCRGETFLPAGLSVVWEHLEDLGKGRTGWRRIVDDESSYKLDRTGVLSFELPDEIPAPPDAGVWIRALIQVPGGTEFPPLPPVSHLMLNTVDGVNLHEFRMEKFSGQGIPHQTVSLRHSPLYVHHEEPESSRFAHPDRFEELRVLVTEEDGERRPWRRAPGNSLLTSHMHDRVFAVDAVEGVLRFGNGIRGKMLPVGNYNLAVEVYHAVPGAAGNVAPRTVSHTEGFSDLVEVHNAVPGNGGRDAESIEQIIRRAPSVLTSRDRAVTRQDFEIIAGESSGEVARAACDGKMGADGVVEVVILPQRRDRELIPDPFLSTGLKEHVQAYLARRSLINVQPVVRLASFQPVDVSLTVRLRPNANFVQLREQAQGWIRRFLDPYLGGIDGQGWPFQGTLFAQDFGRIVSDLAEVRHVVNVQVFGIADDDADPTPGWERGQGADTLVLDTHDLFVVRRVRVRSEGTP